MGGCDMADKNLNMAFPFIFHKEDDGGYFIECPDIKTSLIISNFNSGG